MKKIILSFLALGFLMVQTHAQKALTEGSITFEVTNVSSDDAQTESMLQMMKGTTMDVFFKGERQRVDIDMMGGMMKMTTIIDNDAEKSTTVYMDMMGQKLKIPMDAKEYEKYQNQQPADASSMTVEKVEGETKTIMGYSCQKVNIKHSQAGAEDLTLSAYVTDKIKAPSSVVQNGPNVDLGGFPLEYTMINPQMSLTYQVTSLKEEVADDALAHKDGYKEMTFEEFMQTMSAFGGMGQ